MTIMMLLPTLVLVELLLVVGTIVVTENGGIFVTTAMSISSSSSKRQQQQQQQTFEITGLHRYAVKGLSYDAFESIQLQSNRFPNDRKYAFLQKQSNHQQDQPQQQQFLHKSNYLCSFTHPKFLSQYISTYNDGTDTLELRHRKSNQRIYIYDDDELNKNDNDDYTIDMTDSKQRQQLANYFSKQLLLQQEQDAAELVCVTNDTFQYGNTSAGIKLNNDTNAQTIHIVFETTVDDFTKKLQQHDDDSVVLNPSRFRPNIILKCINNVNNDNVMKPFDELDWIGRTLVVQNKNEDSSSTTTRLLILNKTVRCHGVSIDPTMPTQEQEQLDIPNLLLQHYPEHGPYLGIYCSVVVIQQEQDDSTNSMDNNKGVLHLGDRVTLV